MPYILPETAVESDLPDGCQRFLRPPRLTRDCLLRSSHSIIWRFFRRFYSWNVFFQIPGEPGAWVIMARIRG